MSAFFAIPLIFALSACATHREVTQTDSRANQVNWPPDTRTAQAVIDSGIISQIEGQINFEQMPNSVIVSYHIEGLQPKSRYQIYLHKNQTCDSLNAAVGEPLTKVRVRPDGIAENTFKSEEMTVTKGEKALPGTVIVLRSLDENLGSFAPAVACAEVRPYDSQASYANQ